MEAAKSSPAMIKKTYFASIVVEDKAEEGEYPCLQTSSL
jgi:hypothetical protein